MFSHKCLNLFNSCPSSRFRSISITPSPRPPTHKLEWFQLKLNAKEWEWKLEREGKRKMVCRKGRDILRGILRNEKWLFQNSVVFLFDFGEAWHAYEEAGDLNLLTLPIEPDSTLHIISCIELSLSSVDILSLSSSSYSSSSWCIFDWVLRLIRIIRVPSSTYFCCWWIKATTNTVPSTCSPSNICCWRSHIVHRNYSSKCTTTTWRRGSVICKSINSRMFSFRR